MSPFANDSAEAVQEQQPAPMVGGWCAAVLALLRALCGCRVPPERREEHDTDGEQGLVRGAR